MSSKISSKTSIADLGALVCESLKKAGIEVFLSGGAVVTIYTDNRYESFDLDFISIADRKEIKAVMESLGFRQDKSRHFIHPDTKFFVEFPGAAVMVGDEPLVEFSKLKTKNGILKLLTPTDCVKDRLAAYYHWNDRQGLNQAVEAWSKREGMLGKYKEFIEGLKK